MVTPDLDDIGSWHYELPDELIAHRPAAHRDDARLMVVNRQSQTVSHHSIRDLPTLLSSGDRLVMNNTKVLPARLIGFRTATRGKWEGLFLGLADQNRWHITGTTRGRLTTGESLTLRPAGSPESKRELQLKLCEKHADGSWTVLPESPLPFYELLEQFGTLPLPPYIGRKVADAEDAERYQTVYASVPGAIAAPTAGLHFTDELLENCAAAGIEFSHVTLHVGIGTFRPVSSTRLSDHTMHEEACEILPSVVHDIQQTKSSGGLITAVGTTSVRTLEAAAAQGSLRAFRDQTRLFIQPGYQFHVVDQLLTNFHLPGSTLLVLVAAFADYDLIMEAYRQAVGQRYRFYSYGDAMLIV